MQMKKTRVFLLVLALLLCAGCMSAWAEDEEMSFQQLLRLETPAPTPEEDLPAVVTPTPEPEIQYESDGSVVITLTAVGDVTIGRNVQHSGTSIFEKELKKQGGDINFIFRNVKQIFEADDFDVAALT